jgi:DNA polymerase-1
MAARNGERSKPEAGKVKRLVILDSHAIIHRAYHALPDFSSSKGEPTGALYGLITILLKIMETLKPDFIVAARDLPGPTHRHEAYAAYKATRMKAEDELVAQLVRAPIVFKAFGIPLYEAKGFEADDVIGTIVKDVDGTKGTDTIIASGDMDTLQLVSDHARVFTMRKGLNDIVMYDAEAVRERYGFGPEHIIDYKALRGDPSDNIPGVRGVGEKTATELIKEFGSIEEIYKALEEKPAEFAKKVKPRTIELLKEGKKAAAESKTLATIHVHAPITFKMPDEEWTLAAHAADIMQLCDELEFRSLKERVRVLSGKPLETEEVEVLAPSDVDPEALRETSVALWLLHSDTTNPSLQDILQYANTDDFEKARKDIFAELATTGKLKDVYEKIEKPLIPIMKRMNEVGVHVDVGHLKELAAEYGKELGKIAGRIFKQAGHEFNINSPKQLAAVLYDELKITPQKQKLTAGGARTTREDELVKLAEGNPIIADILSYRELQKLLSTYIEKMPALVGDDGRLHAEFLQAGTTTGRMSSQNPNLQNIPIKTEYGRRIREAFSAERGNMMLAIDYSQIELRIAAGLSGDKNLVRIFKEGGDVHRAVASQVFGVPADKVDYEMRRRAKVINFGILYGMGVNALKVNLSEGSASVSRDEAAAFLKAYFDKFSGLAEYIEKTKAFAAKNGYTETLFGRRRYFAGIKSPLPQIRAQAERMAMNAPMQGTQSDIIKLAMVEADKQIEERGWRGKVRLVLQVHDELVYEVADNLANEAAALIRKTMETIVPSSRLSGVPIKAEASLGKNWGEMEKIY